MPLRAAALDLFVAKAALESSWRAGTPRGDRRPPTRWKGGYKPQVTARVVCHPDLHGLDGNGDG